MEPLSIVLTGLVAGLVMFGAVGAQTVFLLKQGAAGRRMFPLLAVATASDVGLVILGVGGVGSLVDVFPGFITVLTLVGVAFLLGYGVLSLVRAKRAGSETALDLEELEPLEIETDVEAETVSETAAGTGRAGSAGALQTASRLGGGDMSGGDMNSAHTGVATLEDPAPAGPPAKKPVTKALLLTLLAFTWLNPQAYLDVAVILGSMSANYGDPGRWVFAAGVMIASVVWFTFLGFAAKGLGRLLVKKPQAWRWIEAGSGVIMLVLAGVLATHLV